MFSLFLYNLNIRVCLPLKPNWGKKCLELRIYYYYYYYNHFSAFQSLSWKIILLLWEKYVRRTFDHWGAFFIQIRKWGRRMKEKLFKLHQLKTFGRFFFLVTQQKTYLPKTKVINEQSWKRNCGCVGKYASKFVSLFTHQ